MRRVSPDGLLDAVGALPAAAPLLARLEQASATRQPELPDPPVYVVGGAVRDLLLGRTPAELDLCVEADPRALADRLGGAQRVHDRFGTCTVALDGMRYDIARARTETYAHPGALPDVAPADIGRDLRRRDFTVNALALALTGARAGELLTVPHALEDLDAAVLRVLHDASFRDDPTRLLRMARYAARLAFAPEPHTAGLARAAVAGGAADTVAGTRIGNELRLLAREPDPIEAIARLGELGLEPVVAPGFGLSDRGLAGRALELLPADGRPDLLVLAIAFRGVPRRALAERLTELGFIARDRDTIEAAATGADALRSRLREAATPAAVAAAVGRAPAEQVALAGALGAEAAAREWLERLRYVRLEIDGTDLLAAGIEPGPALGAGLRAALADKLDGRLSDRDAELQAALRAARADDAGRSGGRGR